MNVDKEKRGYMKLCTFLETSNINREGPQVMFLNQLHYNVTIENNQQCCTAVQGNISGHKSDLLNLLLTCIVYSGSPCVCKLFYVFFKQCKRLLVLVVMHTVEM